MSLATMLGLFMLSALYAGLWHSSANAEKNARDEIVWKACLLK
jgi:hypothetical protein